MNGERLLVSRHSAYNPIVVTEDELGFRTLRFGETGAYQSVVKMGEPGHLELDYARLFPACLAFTTDPLHVLIVGLGGGSLPAFLHDRFPEMVIDVVEIDEEVVDVAKSFCGFQEDGRMRVYVEDGRDFIERCQHPYDAIFLDSFGTDTIPEHLVTLEFLKAVRAALTPTGVAAANVWGPSINPLYPHMLKTYRAAFEDVYVFDVPDPGTKILAALPQKHAMTRDMLLERSRIIGERQRFDYDLRSCIAGFRHQDEERLKGGKILRDDGM
jgi:spermidine synthase